MVKKGKHDKKESENKKIKLKFSVMKEFREFISRGSVMDLAVGIVIGSSFTAIVNSAVKDIITPFIGVVIGGIDFSSLKITLPSFYPNVERPVFTYGLFIQSVINFLIIAVCVFTLIKFLNTLKGKMESEKKTNESDLPSVPEKSAEILLLEEIRDLLKNKQEDSL